jgi:chloride channel 7
MEDDLGPLSEQRSPRTPTNNLVSEEEGENDPESNSLQKPLLKRSPTLTASHLAMVGAKVSYIESLDYE